MRRPDQVIRAFLTAVRDGCGADMASVFVPSWPGVEHAILTHSGHEPAVPELADIDTALAFLATQPAHDGTAAIASVRRNGALLPIPLVTSLWQESPTTSRFAGRAASPARRASDRQGTAPIAGWLALRFPNEVVLSSAVAPAATGLALGQSALGLAARLASLYLFLYDSLADPLTGLPGRSVLRTLLRRELSLARADGAPLSVLLFNADDFAKVNARYGRDVGDHALREVVSRAQTTLRCTDLLCRHGAATFGVILTNSGREAAAIVAGKLQSALGGTPYLDEHIELSFRMGIASLSPEEIGSLDPVDFMGRAETALAVARQPGSARVCTWRDGAAEAAEPLDRLRHAFTGDQDRDYRNMGLLWDTVGLLASSSSPHDLVKRVTQQLRRALSASMVSFFEPVGDSLELRYALGVVDGVDVDVDPSNITHDQRVMARRAADTHTPVWTGPLPGEPGGIVTCAVPLVVDDTLLAVLLLSGTSGYITVDETDLRFMAGLGGPIGLALERARAADRRRQQDDLEKRRLVGELKGLRTALRQARVIHASPQMEDLLVTAHRVADTDATVLILGESGTGKEMLAQTIHQMSGRRNKPLVVVDCGAIPSTLIESELFGHERGAFTGAVAKSLGRLAQADGGTVLLDEIGELPLEVQSKLLRFVQEKHFTAVGSTIVRRVDVRVIAATNRDLADEVANGRFRGDLYHRLNVIPLQVPPLRERREDILELARHFLEVFAPKYQKAVRGFGTGVEETLVRYNWPGNIRELQNRIMRAVIMSTGDTLTLEALSLPQGTSTSVVAPGSAFPIAEELAATAPLAPRSSTDASSSWVALRDCLDSIVSTITASSTTSYPPLGRWLDNDLVIAAFAQAGHVARRASHRLGLPETTFVRRLRRAQSEAQLVRRPSEWEPVGPVVDRLLRARPEEGQDVLAVAERYLVEAINRHVPQKPAVGAALLGTSLPTYRLRINSLAEAS